MSERPGFFKALMATPEKPLSRLSRFTAAQGLFYMGLGLVLMLSPSSVLTLLTGLTDDGLAVFRFCGFTVVVVGWFYFIGGRTGAASFALATVADRVIVPFACAGFVLSGQLSIQLVAPLAILDPILAFFAWRMWRKGEC